MQGAEAENQAKSRSDEESINFRPSPNFKHMKKYLKSKFEEANQGMASPSSSDLSSSYTHNTREKVNNTVAVVQPPLPPNPPPPDTPPIINLKKEIEDDEYQCSSTVNLSDFSQSHEPKTEPIQLETKNEEVEVTMCRNFARGSCKKGASCIFAHKLILSQLPGVYTFCRNFQNSMCTFPKCKFVHATVFEKEYFFRTGYLPPHTLRHLKEGTVVQPPPPPPPPEETAVVPAPVFPNAPYVPPVQEPTARIKTVSALNGGAASSDVSSSGIGMFRTGQSPIISPKRDWSDTAEFSRSPRDFDFSEPLAKKCKSCDSTEFRALYYKNKRDQAALSAEEIRKKVAEVNRRNSNLGLVLTCFFNRSSVKAEKDTKPFSNVNFASLMGKMIRARHAAECPDSTMGLPEHKFTMDFMK